MNEAREELQPQLDRHRRKVDVERFDITVRELVRMGSSDELHRAPVYQRKFRWEPERESTLIESLFLGLPVPPIYVATNRDGEWEVVDGVQRISTLLHYVADPASVLDSIAKESPLRLEGLERLTSFNDLRFSDLPNTLQLHFFKRSLPVVALSDKSDLVVRYDLFERLNRGGIALTAQEVRSCIYQGPFSEFLREMASDEKFQSLVKLRSKQEDDGTREEIVLKFFAYLHRRDDFDGAVTRFLNEYMSEASKEFDFDANSKLFREVVGTLAQGIDGPVLRENTAVTPINQLEAILVGAAEVLRSGDELAVPAGEDWLNDDELVAASTKGTNTPKMLHARIDRASRLLRSSGAPKKKKKGKK